MLDLSRRGRLALSTFAFALVGAGATGVATALPVVQFAPKIDLSSPLVLAQSVGDPDGGGGDEEEDEGGGDVGAGSAGGGEDDGVLSRRSSGGGTSAGAIASNGTDANNATTKVIVDRLRQVDDHCEKLLQPYRIDCAAQEFRDLASKLPRRGDYADARDALNQVAGELEKIAKANRDRAQARVRLQVSRAGASRPDRTRPITAVKPAAVPTATQQARQAVERGRATLLRSTSGGDPRQVHYQRIAQAFDSAAVLLRS